MPTRKHFMVGMMMLIMSAIVVVYQTNKVLEPSSALYTFFGSLSKIWGHKSKTYVQILLWTPLHSGRAMAGSTLEKPLKLFHDCEQSSCQFTYDRSTLKGGSHAVMFDLRQPQMVINKKVDIPRKHQPGQYWIIYNHEAMFHPDNFYDVFPGNVFNMTATYKRDADIHLPYGKCEQRKHGHYVLPKDFVKKKKGLVVWHVSHCTDRSRRMTFTKKLQKHITVDIFGKCSKRMFVNDRRLRVGNSLSDEATQNINEYKFYLAFENTYCKDYITEKAFKILQDNIYTVPIVRGSGPYKDVLPPGSYINADDFETPKKLAEYLTLLDNDDNLYMEYFKSRKDYQCTVYFSDRKGWMCRLCDGVSHLMITNFTRTYSKTELRRAIHPNKNCVLYD